MTQPRLDDYALSRAVSTTEGAASIEARIWRFHRDHPEVYDEIVRLCREWHGRGGGTWSINGAFEVLRWQRQIAGLPDVREAYKLNNSFRSRYARLIMERERDLSTIFETRGLAAA